LTGFVQKFLNETYPQNGQKVVQCTFKSI